MPKSRRTDLNDGDFLLSKISGKSKENRTPIKPSRERQDLYGKWWEMRLMGATIPEIIKHEIKTSEREYTESQVSQGLDKYAESCLDNAGRTRRMATHRAFVDRLRQIAMTQVQELRRKFKESEGKGVAVHTTEAHYDEKDRLLSSKHKTTFEPVDKAMMPWLKFAVELDKYSATIDGLMGELDNEQDLNVIDINLEGFLGLEDAAPPSLEEEDEPNESEDTQRPPST